MAGPTSSSETPAVQEDRIFALETPLRERLDTSLALAMSGAYSSTVGLREAAERALARTVDPAVFDEVIPALKSDSGHDVSLAVMVLAIATQGGANVDVVRAKGGLTELARVVREDGDWRKAEAAWALGNLVEGKNTAIQDEIRATGCLPKLAAMVFEKDLAACCWSTWALCKLAEGNAASTAELHEVKGLEEELAKRVSAEDAGAGLGDALGLLAVLVKYPPAVAVVAGTGIHASLRAHADAGKEQAAEVLRALETV